MPTLADYYRDLLVWDGVEFRLLVDAWPQGLIAEVKADFIEAVARTQLKGAGYPDQVLSSAAARMPMEIKATGDWNPRDSNRRVLTSSSTKLREQFQSPIFHLLCTVLYAERANAVRVEALRLDFLEPSTAVSVRLEASVSHKLLSQAPHHSVVI